MKTLEESIKFESNEKDLKSGLNESLKDSKFKKLVDKLKLPNDLLEKYTSLLEDSSIEYNNCLNCKNILECKNKVKGHCYLPNVVDKKIEFGYKKCKKQEQLDRENKYLENIYCFNISDEIKRAKMKDIYTDDPNRFEAIKWINNFIKNYDKDKHSKGLYLNGSFGCGKTYLISAMFNELAIKGYKSAIIFWPEYLVNLKTSFGTTDFKDKLDRIKTTPLLLIDDLGAETTTNWSRDEVLCPILQYRMQEKLPTFITSNLDIKLLEKHLSTSKNGIEEVKSTRIIERIKQLTDELNIVSKNYRN